jgi:hypothetical protein
MDANDGLRESAADAEGRTQSFVVRLWLEEAPHGHGASWRGHITHVGTNERRHIRRLDDIGAFIAPYLEQIGGDVGWCWRTRRWLKR